MTKEKLTIEDFVTRCLIFMLLLMFFIILLRMFTKEILIDRFNLNNHFTQLILFDLRSPDELSIKPNPIPSQADDNQAQNFLTTIRQKYNILSEKISFIKNKLNVYASKKIIFKYKTVELANLYNRLINWELSPYDEYNRIITVDKDYLISIQPHFDVKPTLDSFANFKSFLDSKDIPFLYVQVPSKICQYEPSDDAVDDVITFSNATINDFVAGFKEMNVDILELRDEIHNANLNHHNLFFKTDHHWLPETGLWVAQLIAERLNDNYNFNFDTDLLTPERFNYTVYKDAFFGSQGKKVSLSRAKPEDFTLIHPNYPTDFTLNIPSIGLNLSGDFDITYDYQRLGEKKYYNDNPWAVNFHGDKPLTSITNNLVDNNKRVLIIGDSNDNVVVPFLALGIKHIDSLDLRHYKDSLQDLIAEGDYDIVIVIHYIGYVIGLHELLNK